MGSHHVPGSTVSTGEAAISERKMINLQTKQIIAGSDKGYKERNRLAEHSAPDSFRLAVGGDPSEGGGNI